MVFDFNFYSSILLIPFVQGLLFSFLFLQRFITEKKWHSFFLSIFLFALTIRLSFWMLGFAGWYDTRDYHTTIMFYFPFNTLSFLGPALYFYFLSATNNDFEITKKHWPHLALPLLITLLYISKFIIDFVYYSPFSNSEEFQYGARGPLAELDKTYFIYAVSYASLLFYLLITIRDFRTYRIYLNKNFAELSEISLKWLYNLILVICSGFSVLFVFYFLNLFNEHVSYNFNWYPYFIIGIVIYYVSIYGYFNNPRLLRQLEFSGSLVEMEPAEDSTTLPDLDLWKNRLTEIIHSKKVYLDPEISLSDLAKIAGTNSQVLSRIINQGFRQNFNEFINQFRVNEVINKMREGVHLRQTLISIGYDCGFSSKATFNRSFKKVTGKTPKEYIESL